MDQLVIRILGRILIGVPVVPGLTVLGVFVLREPSVTLDIKEPVFMLRRGPDENRMAGRRSSGLGRHEGNLTALQPANPAETDNQE